MPKLSLQHVKDICLIHNYRNSLPQEWWPYFDWWTAQIQSGQYKVPTYQDEHGIVVETWNLDENREDTPLTPIQKALKGMYNENIPVTQTIMIDEIKEDAPAVEEVAEETVPEAAEEVSPAKEETAE